MDSLDVPPSHAPPPPPKRFDKPKITLQIPTPSKLEPARGPNSASSVYWGGTKYYGKMPQTATSHISDPHGNPYFNPFLHMYHNKASDFMFKQFEGFKDFTMNTAKSGLSAGEKSAFWFYNKLKLWSKKWFTHFFLTLCLVLYSIIGATVFMALEGPHEEKYDKNLTDVRREIATRIHDIVINNQSLVKSNPDFLVFIEGDLAAYEENFKEYLKHVNNNDTKKKTWGFWNSMFYAGTIYTTIVVLFLEHCPANIGALALSLRAMETATVIYLGMHEEQVKFERNKTINIPLQKSESETQTRGRLVFKSFNQSNQSTMETDLTSSSIRKRRNLSKNRGQIMRQREKTPEPSRTAIPHEDTTSDDEDIPPQRTSREIEADNTYEEMKRLVQEQANIKDPVYDIDTDEILEARCFAANERRRRSISPFAIPDKEELIKLERKGSFIDPSNKMLSTNYCLSPKDDGPNRRNSLTLESLDTNFSRNSLSPPTSPKEKQIPQPLPSPTKKMEDIVYFDELKETAEKPNTLPKRKETAVDEKKTKSLNKTAKDIEQQLVPGELVTKVIQVERTPSKKLTHESKPLIEIRERVVRTPSTKTSADSKPNVKKQVPIKITNETQNKVPPVKPARSKSSSRIASKTSESEMSEDQSQQPSEFPILAKRKIVPTPRRFIKNRSPRANRSQSITRVENVNVLDKTATGMSQTSHEIIELMQKARARSLSIPKDDPRLPSEYKKYSKILQTPNKTPANLRQARGISCPKTIQIISDREILSGLTTKPKPSHEKEKHSRQSSGYVDASQSEYTSSCYSSSPSENEYDFDLLERSAELTRKLKLLSTEKDNDDIKNNVNIIQDIKEKSDNETKSTLRKRSIVDKNFKKRTIFDDNIDNKNPDIIKEPKGKNKKNIRSRWKLLANWHQFKDDHRNDWRQIVLLRNQCICNLIILVILCGLGGMMFKALEGSFENAYKCSSRNVKRDFIESLWRGSHYLREEDWKSMARKKLHEFEDQLHTAHEAGVTSYSGQRSWNFMNSFVYCMTLVTTIGYGHIAPKTTYGRVATIVYAIIGIPLFLIVLADFGKLFTRIIKFFWSFIRRFYYTRSCRQVRRTVPVQEVMKGLNIVYDVVRRPSQIFSEEDVDGLPEGSHPPPVLRKPSDVPPPLPPKPGYKREIEIENDPETPAPSVFEIDDEFNLPISVAIFILVVYIIIGAVGYNSWEDWSFFESFYFVFISMSTIGLGDLVPNHPMFMMASILYLVFGLALTSMCINVVQVKLSDTFKQASAKIGATIGLKVAEEDGSLVPITPPPVENVPVHKPKVEVEDNKNKEVKKDETKTR